MGKQTFQITLYSGSQKQYVLSNTDKAACVYQINWDALFRGLNVGGKTAHLYIRMVGTDIPEYGTVAEATGNIFLLGLPSSNSVCPDAGGVNVAPLTYYASTALSAQTGMFIDVNTTANVVVPQVILPNGTGQLTVCMLQDDGTKFDYSASPFQYSLTLFFVVDDDE